MTDQPANPAADAAAVSTKWTDRVTGRVHQHIELNGGSKIEGLKGAARQSWGEVKNIVGKDVTLGQRGIGFARVGAVGAGAYVASGAFQSKNADGSDRGALHRLGNLVVGGGMIAGGVLAGGRG